MRAVVLSFIAATLYPALGSGEVDVTVDCGPATVGAATECTATITAATSFAALETGGSSSVKIGTFDNEQGGQPSTAEAVARAAQFDYITAGPSQYKGNVAAMRSANPDLVLSAYVNGTHTRNTTLPETQYCHDASGARIVTNGVWSGNILMNPAHQGWRNTLLTNVNAALTQSGYDGVFLDVLGRGVLQYNVTGYCIDPRTGQEYTSADWERDTSELARSIKAATARPVIANGASRGTIYSAPPPSSVIAQYVNGGLAEGFTRNGAFFEGYYTESQVLKDISMVADAPAMHVLAKDWRAVSQDTKDREMRYAFAAFLLATNGNDVFGWTGSQGARTAFDPLWDVDLGAPVGPSSPAGPGRYRRDFTNGHVILDTVTHTGSIVVATADDHTVTWTSSGNGTFETSRCTSDGGTTTTCQVRYTPGASGPQTITAVDAPEAGSSGATGTTSISVSRRATTAEVSCATPVTLPDQSTCTVQVRDGSASPVAPTGEVTFAVTGTGTFGSPRCSLVAGSASTSNCSVSYTPSAEGEHRVSAAYAGDVDHQTSSSAPFTVVAQPKSVPEPEPTPEPTPTPTPEPEPVVDTVAPVVTITSPADGTSIKKGRKLIITATATDETGVTRVDFASNGKVVCSDTTPGSWTCSWNVAKNSSDGGFDVMVTAYDAAGNSASRGISVKVITGRV